MKETLKYSSLLVVAALALACGGDSDAQAAPEQPAAQAAATPAAETATPQQAVQLPEGVTPEMVTRGEGIFTGAGICFTCHLAGGVGGPLAPNLTDATWLHSDGSYAAIINTITTGVAQPKEHPAPMLPKGGSSISDDDVRAVAAYVWTLSHHGN